MGCVYLATSPSGKQYVGMTTRTLTERWQQHCYDARKGQNYALKNAIRKYGADAFTLEVLFRSDATQELFDREIAEIAKRRTTAPYGYNMTFGGEGALHTPETCTSLSAIVTAYFAQPGAKQAAKARAKVCQNRPETKARKASRMTDHWALDGVKERRSAMQQINQNKPDVQESRLLGMGSPRVLIEGALYRGFSEAGRAIRLTAEGVRSRTKRGIYVAVPRHGDPACDAVEETWAIMQWAKANPDHPNVPDWARPDRPKHGVAPAWAQQRLSKAA